MFHLGIFQSARRFHFPFHATVKKFLSSKMKLNWCILIFISLGLTSTTSSQNWFQPEDTWISYFGIWPLGGHEEMKVLRDTIIQSKNCKILERNITMFNIELGTSDTINWHPFDQIIVHENNDSVFFYNDSTFQMIYNFNLNSGDTISIDVEYCNEKIIYWIDSVALINIDGFERRIQYATVNKFSSQFIQHTVQIIEGIGIVHARFEYPNGIVTDRKFGYLIPQDVYVCYADGPGWGFNCFSKLRFYI